MTENTAPIDAEIIDEPVQTSPVNMSPASKSPITTSKTDDKLMDFGEAMKKVLAGAKIHKLEWSDKNYYGLLDDTILKLHKPDNKLYSWILNEGDISGEDYIVL